MECGLFWGLAIALTLNFQRVKADLTAYQALRLAFYP